MATDIRQFVLDTLSATYPDLDLRDVSALSALVVDPSVHIDGELFTQVETLRAQFNLAAITENPDTIDTDLVDAILSNFRVTRGEGTQARGLLRIVLSSNASMVVDAVSTFTIDEKTFTPEKTWLVTTNISDTETQLELIQTDDAWYFLLPVVSVETGVDKNVKDGESAVWDNPPYHFVSATVESDFEGGTSTDSGQVMLEKAALGMTMPAHAGRQNIQALVRAVYPATVECDAFGLQDAEMRRNGHNIFGIKTGAHSDIVVRTAAVATRKTLTLDGAASGSTVTLNLSRAQAMGVLRVVAVTPVGQTADLSIDTIVYGTDVSGIDYPTPEIHTVGESMLTPFQTLTVTFQHTTPVASYYLTVDTMPGLDVLETALMDDTAVRAPGQDTLVRLPWPLFLSVSMTLSNASDVNTTTLVDSVKSYIHSLRFTNELVYASKLVDVVHALLPDTAGIVLPISMTMQYPTPTGTVEVASKNSMEKPSVQDLGISYRNSVFLADTISFIKG